LKQQQQFNNALTADHKAKTSNMKSVMAGDAATAADDAGGADQVVKID